MYLLRWKARTGRALAHVRSSLREAPDPAPTYDGVNPPIVKDISELKNLAPTFLRIKGVRE